MSDRPRTPRVHWVLMAVVLGYVAALLLLNAVLEGRHGEGPHAAGPGTGSGGVPAAVRDGGPVIDAAQPSVPGLHVRRRTVALTFDDGPSSWTPQILAVLERHHVPATFFVVGDAVTARPDLLRRMLRDGDDIGVHTFTHPDLGDVSAAREHTELDMTQLAISSATGHTTALLRLPYTSTAGALTTADWRSIRRATGYRVVLTDLDTRDWTRPGVDRIVAAATPRDGAGAIVMMHDGGGNRSQTVAALERLIPLLQSRGYRFATVSDAVGLRAALRPAGTWERVRGWTVIATVSLAHRLADWLDVLFLAFGALSVIRIVVLLACARRHARIDRAAEGAVPDGELPPLSIIVPAYNEQAGIAACVRSLAACDYPRFEIVVVDDGSTDATAEVVRGLRLPGLRLVSQANAGKPAALNRGIAEASHDLLVLVDGDTVFEPTTLRELVRPLRDPAVGAVSGNAKVGNRNGLLGRWQHIEYVMGFNLDRRMFDVLGCMPTVPGAIGLFRRSALRRAAGISDDTLAEDTDITMALCRAGERVVYAPRARAWTEAPGSFGQLWSQRYRWCYGTMQAIWKHRRALVERGPSGTLGRRGLPYLLTFQVILPLLAPVIDVVAAVQLVTGRAGAAVLVWSAVLAVQVAAAAYAFVLDGERLRTVWALPLQQFVYRQMMYLVVVASLSSAVHGVGLRWHKLARTGRLDSAPPAGTTAAADATAG